MSFGSMGCELVNEVVLRELGAFVQGIAGLIGKAERLREGESETVGTSLISVAFSHVGCTSFFGDFARDGFADDVVARLSSEAQEGPMAGLIGKTDRESEFPEYGSTDVSSAAAVFADDCPISPLVGSRLTFARDGVTMSPGESSGCFKAGFKGKVEMNREGDIATEDWRSTVFAHCSSSSCLGGSGRDDFTGVGVFGSRR